MVSDSVAPQRLKTDKPGGNIQSYYDHHSVQAITSAQDLAPTSVTLTACTAGSRLPGTLQLIVTQSVAAEHCLTRRHQRIHPVNFKDSVYMLFLF